MRHAGEMVQPLAKESITTTGYTLTELKAMMQLEDPLEGTPKVPTHEVFLLQQLAAHACTLLILPNTAQN